MATAQSPTDRTPAASNRVCPRAWSAWLTFSVPRNMKSATGGMTGNQTGFPNLERQLASTVAHIGGVAIRDARDGLRF